MTKPIREQLIERLAAYLQTAEDWDVYEIIEWAFGYDDPAVEQFKEKIKSTEVKD